MGVAQHMDKEKNVKDKKPVWCWGPKSSSENASRFYASVRGCSSN
jgi:hypothetical protein